LRSDTTVSEDVGKPRSSQDCAREGGRGFEKEADEAEETEEEEEEEEEGVEADEEAVVVAVEVVFGGGEG
jgi:hypothetical protein